MIAGWLSKAARRGGGSALTALGAAGLICALLSGQSARVDTSIFSPSKDNTIFEDSPGNLSDGAGPFFYVGNNGRNNARRGLIAFDLSSVPKGATVTSVKLNVRCTRTPNSTTTSTSIELHRLLHSWGEGTSNSGSPGGRGTTAAAGDTTWNSYSNPSGAWATKGGDFDPTFSIRSNVSGVAAYSFGSTPRLVSDVQGWLDDPLSNNGWILIGNEVSLGTARQFVSRQNTTIANRPTLTLEYTVPEPHATAVCFIASASLLARRRRQQVS